ncbi:baseplate J/gp47 family protein [Cellulosimicrobium terreum]|nr:baseplate J/gp47 family protein [Cellulosimicrobium terreum]
MNADEHASVATGTVPSNPPGQDRIAWRVAPHGAALERLRAALADGRHPQPVRSLATHGSGTGSPDRTADPAVALLDAWAVVGDVVSFYTERIATEGLLRTATESRSVRELARTLGYELRPGVAARTDLAWQVETAPGAPASVIVPAGTPVQTIPAPGSLPQVFETSDEVEARGAWNELAAHDRVPQPLGYGTREIWLTTTAPAVRSGDHLLVVGRERRDVAADAVHSDDHERWELRRVAAVDTPEEAPGWTRLRLDRRIGFRRSRTLVAEEDVRVYSLSRRLSLFGWNAPDPALLNDQPVPWPGYALRAGVRELELDGDAADVVPGSWLVLDQPGRTEAFQVSAVVTDGATKFGLSGKLTRVTVDLAHNIEQFRRNGALVLAVSTELPATWMPSPVPLGAGDAGTGHTLDVAVSDPPLPADRAVLVTGVGPGGEVQVEVTTVVAVQAVTGPAGGGEAPGDPVQRLTLEPPLVHDYRPGTVRVLGNVTAATHGETVEHVLGSGDGREVFASFALRRPSLTYVRTTTNATGAAAALQVRVEDVAWAEVETLHDAGPTDQVYVVRQDDTASSTVTFGDGVHGSRLPSGVENVRAVYRIGLGADGVAEPGQVSLPVRRPRGIATVRNLAASRDWAPPEDLESARTNAPQRVRTLDRAVSVDDYGDFARAFSGVGSARADLVWDGRTDTVVVSVLAADGGPASVSLIADLAATIDGARDERAPRVLLAGEVLDVGARIRLQVDPRFETEAVREAVSAALLTRFGGLPLAVPVAAARVLVTASEVDGVVSATVPRLVAPAATAVGDDLLVAEEARWDGTRLLPAQALRLTAALMDVEVVP